MMPPRRYAAAYAAAGRTAGAELASRAVLHAPPRGGAATSGSSRGAPRRRRDASSDYPAARRDRDFTVCRGCGAWRVDYVAPRGGAATRPGTIPRRDVTVTSRRAGRGAPRRVDYRTTLEVGRRELEKGSADHRLVSAFERARARARPGLRWARCGPTRGRCRPSGGSRSARPTSNLARALPRANSAGPARRRASPGRRRARCPCAA